MGKISKTICTILIGLCMVLGCRSFLSYLPIGISIVFDDFWEVAYRIATVFDISASFAWCLCCVVLIIAIWRQKEKKMSFCFWGLVYIAIIRLICLIVNLWLYEWVDIESLVFDLFSLLLAIFLLCIQKTKHIEFLAGVGICSGIIFGVRPISLFDYLPFCVAAIFPFIFASYKVERSTQTLILPLYKVLFVIFSIMAMISYFLPFGFACSMDGIPSFGENGVYSYWKVSTYDQRSLYGLSIIFCLFVFGALCAGIVLFCKWNIYLAALLPVTAFGFWTVFVFVISYDWCTDGYFGEVLTWGPTYLALIEFVLLLLAGGAASLGNAKRIQNSAVAIADARDTRHIENSIEQKGANEIQKHSFCVECGKKIENVKFCPYCGMKQPSYEMNIGQMDTEDLN